MFCNAVRSFPEHRTLFRTFCNSSSNHILSIWRRKREMSKEGLFAVKELKRLQSDPFRLNKFFKKQISRLLKSDLVSVMTELQRQDQVFICMKLYDVVRNEIWYRPDMYFHRDMLMLLARNKKAEEAMRVWQDLRGEGILFDQHTFGDLVRAFADHGLTSEAMFIYDEMRRSPEQPLSLPYRVILRGLVPYSHLRDKVKDDFMLLFPHALVYDSIDESSGDKDRGSDTDMD